MNAGDTIQALTDYAHRVRDAATADRTRAAGDRTAGLLDAVIRSADAVLQKAASPVTVGVVGGFNAGKSMLLGSLVGWGDVVPVSEIPTTGNLTELRLIPTHADCPSVVDAAAVEFLDRRTATTCLAEMVVEATRAEVGPALAGEWAAAQALAGAAAWGDVAEWVGRVARHPSVLSNPDLRSNLGELAAFVRHADTRAGRELLDAADPAVRARALTPDVVREALVLPRVAGPDAVPAALAGPVPELLTPAFISAAFPLIARVRFDVRVPKAVWNFGPVPEGGSFVLLDTPGLGAGDSKLRDLILCVRALRDVQTILVVLDAQTPGDVNGQKLVGMLHTTRETDRPPDAAFKDRVLVAVNRFDLLSLDGHEEQFRAWTGWDPTTRSFGTPTERATPARVRGALLALDKALQSAALLTDPAQTLLTSARWALIHLGTAARPGVPVGSPGFVGRFRGEGWPPQLADQWGRLAVQFAGDPDRLGYYLTEVTGDGGRAALQRMLVDHVARHGLAQHARDVRQAAERLRDAVDRLPPPPTPAAPGRLTTAELRHLLRDLIRELGDHTARSETAELTVERNRRPVPVGHLVGVSVGQKVQAWGVWRDLLNAVGADGRIALEAPAADPLGYEETAAGSGPDDSRALVAPYRETLEEVDRELTAQLSDALKGVFARMGADLRPVTDRLAPVLGPDTEQRVAALVDGLSPADQPRFRNQWRILTEVSRVDAPDVFARFEKAVAARPHPAPPLDVGRCFPLPGANDHEPPMPFPWHPARRPLSSASHVPFLIKLQDHMNLGLRHHASSRLSRLSEDSLDTLRKLLRRWRDELEALLGNGKLLTCLTDEVAPTGVTGWQVTTEPVPEAALGG